MYVHILFIQAVNYVWNILHKSLKDGQNQVAIFILMFEKILK